MERHPHRRQPAHLVAMLAWFLVVLTGTGCALPVLRPTAVSTATPAYTCTPTQTRDEVLTAGTLTVRSLYAEELRYVDDATSHPHADRVNLWHDDVLAQASELYNFPFAFAIGNRQVAERILSSASPDDFRCVVADMERAGVGQIALQALERDTAVLSGPPTMLDLLPWPLSTPFPELNLVGGTSSTESIAIQLWESAPALRKNPTISAQWARYIPAAAAHEDLEVLRYDRIGLYTTAYVDLLANMVTDGMADSFATAQTQLMLSWDNVFSPQQEQQIWQRIQPELLKAGDRAQQSAVMFGDATQGFPPDTGYTIGFHIVQGYLARHPGAAFSTLAGLSTAAIFDGSGYTG
jgi:hypothetical protein